MRKNSLIAQLKKALNQRKIVASQHLLLSRVRSMNFL